MATDLEKDLKEILNEKATKLKPENLKKDITLLGVTGTLEAGSIDTSDATATANDIVNPTTAYVKDEKIVGNIMVTSKTLDPELKRLNDVSTTDTSYRIRAANYKYGIAIIDTLNTDTSGGATASVNFGKFSNGTISVLDKTLGPTDFGFSDSATITGVDLRTSLSKENTLLVACCIVDSSNIYLATCNYDVTTNSISDTHVSSNYISGKATTYDTVRPYIHPLHDFVTLAFYGFIGYCFLTEEYTIMTLKSQSGSAQGGAVLSYNSDYNKGILSFGTITNANYLINYNFTTNTITLQTLSGFTDKLCFVENMVFGVNGSGDYNVYSLNGSTLSTVFTDKRSFTINTMNSIQMMALGNCIFWYDADRTYRLILNLSDYSLTISSVAGGAIIKNCWKSQNFIDFVNANEGKYHLYASNVENIIYIHTVEGTEVTDTITRNGSTLYNTYTDTATTADIISGKTAHSSSGEIIGTMVDNGTLEYTPSEQEQTIPAGYTSGGTVKAIDYSDTLTPNEYKVCDALATNILGSSIPYTELEYIQSSGTQYIDTGIMFDVTNCKIIMDFQYVTPSVNTWFCGVNMNFEGGIDTNTSVFYAKAGFTYSENDTSKRVTATGINTTTLSANTYMFARNWSGQYGPASIKLYSAQVYKNDVLVRDFIPIKDLAGTVCLYDKISATNFYNAGTGNFIAGGAV